MRLCCASEQEPDELFETISQALLNAVDRDCLAGWGAVVHIMYVHVLCVRVACVRVVCVNNQNVKRKACFGRESHRKHVACSCWLLCLCSEKDKITTKELKARMD